ncbi:MAG TPA: alpha/beta hydrolase [Chitinophagaceae bacterium]|nr:alpha/beta hydrolase [Chitinophagaceae bacterium]
MKKILLTISCIIATCLLFGQNNSNEYSQFKKRGDSLYKVKDYKNSAIAYTSAVRFASQKVENNIRWSAASSWSLGNYPDSAFSQLNSIANSKNLTFSFFVDIMSDDDFTLLYKDKRWQKVKDKMFITAKKTFTTSLQKSGGIVPDYERIYAAFAWAMFNQDSAFSQLQIMANTKGVSFGQYNNVRFSSVFSAMHRDERWQLLLDAIYKNAENSLFSPQDDTYTQQEIIYGRKDGMALTLMYLKPKSNSNGKAVIHIRSSSWRSSILSGDLSASLRYLQKGYTVFIVVHGSAPVYTIPDALADIQRAVRFIRYHAKDYQVDPDKIGVTGSSAGGHLSLLCGLMDTPPDENAGDPVDRVSAKVQAVACYYPPTDFLNWGAPGQNVMKSDLMKSNVFNHLFEIRQWNPQRRLFKYITDTSELNKILFQISPINNVSANDAPVLILHGDQDNMVPIQQSETLVKKLQAANVPVSLTIKTDGGHGWDKDEAEIKMFIDWFDKYLK